MNGSGLAGRRLDAAMPRSAARPGRLVEALRHLGPGLMVAVGYVDPGNWATGLAAGSAFGMDLLSVILAASLAGLLLQGLAAKLGIATGLDLAQACRARYPPGVTKALWVLCETAICACDLAELLGAAIALNLLFRLPLIAGASLTALDVFLIMGLRRLRLGALELVTAGGLAVVLGAFLIEVVLSRPAGSEALAGLASFPRALGDSRRLYLAVGILGATVMPHNLYLHSALVRSRGNPRPAQRDRALRAAILAGVAALSLTALANAAILALSAATFHRAGLGEVTDLAQAQRLLLRLLGPAAGLLFAASLLASAQSATLTVTLAGQVVMEGFTNLRLTPWKRRLLTRGLALAPTLAVLAFFGQAAAGRLLVLSQVLLSLQLPFALVPLVRFTSDRELMGSLTNSRLTAAAAWAVCAVVVGADLMVLPRMLHP